MSSGSTWFSEKTAEEQLALWEGILPGLTRGDVLERAMRPSASDRAHTFIMPSPYAIASTVQGAIPILYGLKTDELEFAEWIPGKENLIVYAREGCAFHRILEHDRRGDYWVIRASFSRGTPVGAGVYEVAGALLTHPGLIVRDFPNSFVDCIGSKPKGSRYDSPYVLRFSKKGKLYWLDYSFRGDLHMGRLTMYMVQ